MLQMLHVIMTLSLTCDDGSCLLVYGCTDTTNVIMILSLTCDDGSCLTVYGCTDDTLIMNPLLLVMMVRVY